MPEQNNITGFAEKVSRYFLDFLETDFKRQQAPHRRIQLQNDSGFRTAQSVLRGLCYGQRLPGAPRPYELHAAQRREPADVLYVCELRFRNAVFPVFYIPATVKLNETNGALMVEFDPHLFIHKRAIDYIVQELGPHAAGLGPIDNRIIYLDPQKPFIDEIDRVLTKILPILNLTDDFDVRQPKIQTLASANLRLSKTAYFAVFDKSDESLLNDYEALLSEDHQEVTALFQRIIHGFLLDDPISARERVSDHWDKMPIPDRLVATSPVPLNEEQRKIIRALDDPDCRFIAIQGPPGTGKSHTITAIAFDYILNGKNILILSDKQEALDVVEDKLKLALASVRQDDDFPDPILRLGRTGNTYARLISQAAQERIRDHYRAARTHVKRLSDETEATKQKIQQAITQTIDAYATVSLKEVEELHQLEEQIEASTPGCTKTLQSPKGPGHLDRLEAVMKKAARAVAAHEFFSRRFESGPYEALLLLVQGYAAVVKLNHLRPMKPALSLFNPLAPATSRCYSASSANMTRCTCRSSATCSEALSSGS